MLGTNGVPLGTGWPGLTVTGTGQVGGGSSLMGTGGIMTLTQAGSSGTGYGVGGGAGYSGDSTWADGGDGTDGIVVVFY